MTFMQEGNSRLQEIDWEDWFRSFDERELVFIYQEMKTDGSQSKIFRLDNPVREHGQEPEPARKHQLWPVKPPDSRLPS